MTFRNTIVAAAIALCTPIAAFAAPINALGTYDLANIDFEALAPRGVWTGGSGLVSGNGASNLWDVESGGGTFTINADNTARLTGVATNIGTNGALKTDLQFTYDLVFNFVSDLVANPQAGYCQFGGPKIACSNPATPANVSVLDWDFFDLASGTFDFVGSYGMVSYDITDRSNGTHKGQAGKNANALIADDGNGFSMWFDATQKPGGIFAVNSGYTFAQTMNGDFNVNMAPSAVPLPAAGWMLIAGLGGLAAVKRRKRA